MWHSTNECTRSEWSSGWLKQTQRKDDQKKCIANGNENELQSKSSDRLWPLMNKSSEACKRTWMQHKCLLHFINFTLKCKFPESAPLLLDAEYQISQLKCDAKMHNVWRWIPRTHWMWHENPAKSNRNPNTLWKCDAIAFEIINMFVHICCTAEHVITHCVRVSFHSNFNRSNRCKCPLWAKMEEMKKKKKILHPSTARCNESNTLVDLANESLQQHRVYIILTLWTFSQVVNMAKLVRACIYHQTEF